MIMKVKELVQVEEVDRALTKMAVQLERQRDAGGWVGAAQRSVFEDTNAAAGEGQGQEEVRL
jgi:hypothetical protein